MKKDKLLIFATISIAVPKTRKQLLCYPFGKQEM